MASDKIINLRIDVKKLNKEHFYTSAATGAVYCDLTLFYTEKKDNNGLNGGIKQKVNKATYDAEKGKPNNEKTDLGWVGNADVYVKGSGALDEAKPGYSGAPANATSTSGKPTITDDLPF